MHNHSRRYCHEGEGQKREDRPEILERSDELPLLWAEAQQVVKQGIKPIRSIPFKAIKEG